MEFQLPIQIDPLPIPFSYKDRILLIGSCFTEHIGNRLTEFKFETLQNPNGILFDPYSVSGSLVSYIRNKEYTANDLVYLNELWQSWQHHSSFSDIDREKALDNINSSIREAHEFLKNAKWLVITFGTSFSYQLVENELPVANCHRAPSALFRKHLMSIEEIKSVLDNCFHQLFHFNPNLQILLTVSPVRHVRDGVVDNNRSKARLIETVHHFVSKFNRLYYFPAYELVTDVLRDYRFYDADMVHPNYQATSFVLEQFGKYCIDEGSQKIMEEVQKTITAYKHRPFQPETSAHKQFLQNNLHKTLDLQKRFPFLKFEKEIAYFSDLL